jgi:hypothetical protein
VNRSSWTILALTSAIRSWKVLKPRSYGALALGTASGTEENRRAARLFTDWLMPLHFDAIDPAYPAPIDDRFSGTAYHRAILAFAISRYLLGVVQISETLLDRG